MNRFFDTAVGKSLKTLLWIIAAYVLVFISTSLTHYHWPVSLAQAGVPGIVNWLLYTANVFVDKEIPNTKNSTPMQLVPLNPTDAVADIVQAAEEKAATTPQETPVAQSPTVQ